MSMFRNVMVYLGLGPDEEYDDQYLYDDDGDAAGYGGDEAQSHGEWGPDTADVGVGMAPAAVGGPAAKPSSASRGGTVGSVRPIRPVPSEEETGFTVRPIPSDDTGGQVSARPVAVQRTKPRALSPQSFGDAKILADEFKRSVPVVMNIQDVDRDLARRLIDFSSGVCYSLGGSMEKLATDIFLVTPKGVEVSADDRRRIEERGFDR